MAAVSLFWNTNMAAVTSCENALYILGSVYKTWRTVFFLLATPMKQNNNNNNNKTYDVIKLKNGVSRDTATAEAN